MVWRAEVRAVAGAKGEKSEQFYQRHEERGREAALWLARRRARCRLREFAELAGGLDHAAVGQSLSRFGRRLARQPELRHRVTEMQRQLSNVDSAAKAVGPRLGYGPGRMLIGP
jgi:hypothetical protein